MGIRCRIHFEKRNEDYFIPGDVVRGQINYTLDNDTSFTGIELCFKGRARCQWTERKHKRTMHCMGVQNIFSHSVGLLDRSAPTIDGKVVVPAGSYTHDFQFQLPTTIPYSFKKNYGNYVEYHFKLCFSKPELFKWNQVFRNPLKVAPFLDLSSGDYSTFREPALFTITKPLKVMFSHVGDVTARVSLPSTAFTPGQSVPITFDVQNNTTLAIPCIKAKINKIRIYTASSGLNNMKVSSVCKGLPSEGIERGEQKTVSCEIVVPPDTLPSLKHCAIISVNYVLQLKVCFPGMRSDARLNIPIVIGNLVHPGTPGPHPGTSAVEEAGAVLLAPWPSTSHYDNAHSSSSTLEPPSYESPPSYWEAMQLDEKADDD